MAHKFLYICDLCGKQSENNILSKYELFTDYCGDVMHKANNTKTLELCSVCANNIILEYFKQDGERNEQI